MYSRKIDRVIAEERAGQTEWLLSDHIGTVRDRLSATGAVLTHYQYDSFGQLLDPSSSNAHDLLFAGRDFSEVSGLGDFRHRSYDASLGRFTQEDPLRPYGYGYADNSPLLFIDPTGELTVVEYGLAFDFGCTVLTLLAHQRGVAGTAVAFTAVADGLAGLPVDADAVRTAVLEGLKGIVANPLTPCGLDHPFL